MPIYVYVCPVHGQFDRLQPLGGVPPLCPQCGQQSRRVISSPGVIRVIHNESLPYDATERVYDRRRMMKDTVVQKKVAEFKEQAAEGPAYPFR